MLSEWLAVTRWFPRYNGELARSDAIAGVSLAAFAVPESIAYASLAGLPPVAGLYCYLVAGIAYALFGTSKRLAVGPTSALALLIASSLMPLAHGDVARYTLLSSATAIVVGAISITGRFLRVGYVQNFIGTVVLLGFKAGAGVFIASTQLPKIFGVSGGNGNVFTRLWALGAQLPHTHVPSLFLGAGAVAALLLLARFFPGRPTTLGIVATILVLMHSGVLGHLGIAVAGHIPDGLPRPSFAALALSVRDLQDIMPIALACFILAYAETISVARSFADAHGETVDADEELLALGATNIAAGAFHGFPVAGGMSQSAVNDMAGARTQLSLVATSLVVAVTLLFFAGVFSATPEPLLGAIVVVAAVHLVNVADLRKLWRRTRTEFWVAVFAAAAVLFGGLLNGVMWAVIFSLVMVLQRAARPEIAVLGELPGTTMYVNVEYNANAVVRPGLLALRTYGPWLYFNAGYIRDHVRRLIDQAPVEPELVVLDFSASPVLDVQAMETLEKIRADLEARGIRLRLARLYDETARRLRKTTKMPSGFTTHESIHDAVTRYFSGPSQERQISESSLTRGQPAQTR